ncbi:SusC/RagA family TonB-linked outer membrane protein [Pedobacter psychrodurus]|uniref:SusC/RagA family TonB-linked outer membrane protein n=1 Tax=Pedobacter psychrodurus TaxID=2530456 RepID=UPI0029317AB6|nr:SusC/RagA family TonB-linked outer membrane protein [Pedobacter psychrodurus]
MREKLPADACWKNFVRIMIVHMAVLAFFSPKQVTAALGPKHQAQKNISGTVSDESGTGIPGVSVQVKGENIRVATDKDGKYNINPTDNGAVLVFSMIGFATQEMAVGDRTTVNIRLIPTETSLNSVVVVGYGTQKRERITTAVASVKAENFVKGSVQDAAQLIRGKVAGLNVITQDANPTGTSQINLRGIATITSGTAPLVLIDNVPGSLTTVAPEDIESIDVLKDGSAAAIYGTRGTNGVILITTKKVHGETPPTVDINSYVTTQQITKRLDFMSADEYRKLVAEKRPGAADYGATTDWLREITRTPFSQVHNISLRGGSKNTSYIANLNYRSLEGIILRSDNKVIYPRLEVNHRMFEGRLKINAALSGSQQTFNAGTDGGSYRGDVYRNGITYNPTDPVKDVYGNWTEHTDKTAYANPVSLLMETQGKNQNTNFRTVGTVSYTPVQGLELSLMGSRDLNNGVRGYYETKKHYSTLRDGRNGFASRGTTRSEENLLEATVNYNKKIGNHEFSGLAGYSWRETNYQDYWMQNWDFPTDAFTYNNIGSGLALARGEAPERSYQSQNKLIGYFFRVNYSYQNRYLLMASIRREGSSKFGLNNKYGNFPAVSIGWNIRNEDFMSGAAIFDVLKLRGGFGITGTEPNDPYMSLNRLNFDTYTLVDGKWIQAISPSTNANPDLRWERKQEVNIGLDFALLKNRISGSIDLYRRTTKDLLLDYSVPTPPYLFNTIRANAASMENKGLEMQINVSAIDHKDFKWNTSVNYSANRNKLLSLSDQNFQLASGYFDVGNTDEPIQQSIGRVQLGQPIGNFYGFRSLDIDQNGYWIIQGKDGGPKPIAQQQADDKQIIGNGLPRHYLNFNNTFLYKSFDLTITMRGAFGFQILNMPRMFYSAPVMLTRGNVLRSTYDNIYDKRPLANDQSLNYLSYYIENGDYWKVDNITLGYRFNLKKQVIKNLRIYASGSNLKTFTGYSGVDPEVSVAGLTPGVDDRNRYPATATFTLGASLTF